jgi:hypothetical protein
VSGLRWRVSRVPCQRCGDCWAHEQAADWQTQDTERAGTGADVTGGTAPECAGWMPQSNMTPFPWYRMTQHERPTSWPAPRGRMLTCSGAVLTASLAWCSFVRFMAACADSRQRCFLQQSNGQPAHNGQESQIRGTCVRASGHGCKPARHLPRSKVVCTDIKCSPSPRWLFFVRRLLRVWSSAFNLDYEACRTSGPSSKDSDSSPSWPAQLGPDTLRSLQTSMATDTTVDFVETLRLVEFKRPLAQPGCWPSDL